MDFFNNLRTPAALIGGAALANAFAMAKLPDDKRFDSWGWRFASKTYTMLMLFAFGLEFMTVFMATAAGVRVTGGGYNPMADTPVALLVREFELEYVTIRSQFFTGVLSFLLAQAIRVRKELVLVSPALARTAFLFLLFAVLNVLSFFGSQLVYYDGYFALMRSYFKLNGARLNPTNIFTDPAAAIASLFLLGAFASLGQVVVEKTLAVFPGKTNSEATK